MKKLEITDSRIQEAIFLYKSGKAIKPICKQLHLDDATLRKFLIEEGILRTRAESVRNGKSKAIIKDDAFDILTPEALYWIGFLYADGNLEKGRNRINLTLSDVDINHLKKYSTFIGEGLELRNVTQNMKENPAPGQINFDSTHTRVSFSSFNIYNKLLTLGFSHNKSLTIAPHDLLKGSRDFWRGVVDGDGSLYYSGDTRNNGKYNMIKLELSGTESTINGFLDFLKWNNILTNAKPIKDKRSNVWKVSISDVNYKAIKLLYQDATVYLDRKYNKYLEIIKQT